MNGLAEGRWLTRDRVAAAAIASALTAVAMLAVHLLGGSGTVDSFGRPLGTDYSVFWNAGRLALDGDPATAWDVNALNAAARETHESQSIPDAAWLYPPVFLLVAACLASLPYLPSLLIWQGLSVGLAAALLRRLLPDPRSWLVALATPLTPLVLLHGQNAFLTAALLGFGLLLLHRRPWLAGALLGCLVYKPQLGLMIVPLLLFMRSWRAVAGAVLSGSLLLGLSTALWGLEPWRAFMDSLPLGRMFMEQGSVGFHKSASLFAAVRLWGASIPLAYGVQALGILLGLAMVWLLRRAEPALRAAGVCAAVALSTPYLLDYELAIVGAGAAFLWSLARKEGFRPYERTLVAYIWAMPLASRAVVETTGLPLGPAAAIMLAAAVTARALQHGHAAIHVQRLPGNVPGLAACKIDHRRADILA